MASLPDLNTMSLDQLYAHLAASGLVRRLIDLARDEDLCPLTAPGELTDVTTGAWPIRGDRAALLTARARGIIAGLACLPTLVESIAPEVEIQPRVRDGDQISEGETVARVRGPAHQVLALERSMLNLLSRLSGVATLASSFVREARKGSAGVAVLDTRKTTPGMRVLEKYAVRCGGAMCHRIGLWDAVLIKDNHVAGLAPEALAARVAEASSVARRSDVRFIEVEVDRLDQLDALLRLAPGVVDIILLDNMTLDQLGECVRRRDARREKDRRVLLEASGGVRLETIAAIARTGVDRISAGAITHQATSLDLALDFQS